MKIAGRLSHEILVNLAENGVKPSVFSRLIQNNLVEIVDKFMKWDDTIDLWRTVARHGGVLFQRRTRECGGEARSRGYEKYETADDAEEEDDDEDGLRQMQDMEKSTAWWWDEISGCPSTLEETVMVLLDSGFTPAGCPVLQGKLKPIVRSRLLSSSNCKPQVNMSCTAFIIPGKIESSFQNMGL